MNPRVFSALLGALSVFTAALGVAAAPHYAVVDLGATAVAGAALLVGGQPIQSRPDLPSSGGTNCQFGVVNNHVYAQFGNMAVGDTCVDPIGQEAAIWRFAGSTATLTVLGTLPGSHTDIFGIYSVATGFNTVGDIVGSSQSAFDTAGHVGYPYVPAHGFIYNNGNWTDLTPIAGPSYYSGASAVNDSHEVVGSTNTISSVTGEVLNRAFLYVDGTMYNLTFYLVDGPKVLLTDATGIDCQGNIGAVGTPAGVVTEHSYLLIRQGPARTNCPK